MHHGELAQKNYKEVAREKWLIRKTPCPFPASLPGPKIVNVVSENMKEREKNHRQKWRKHPWTKHQKLFIEKVHMFLEVVIQKWKTWGHVLVFWISRVKYSVYMWAKTMKASSESNQASWKLSLFPTLSEIESTLLRKIKAVARNLWRWWIRRLHGS